MAISKDSLRVRALEVAADLSVKANPSPSPAKVVDAARLFLDFLDPRDTTEAE